MGVATEGHPYNKRHEIVFFVGAALRGRPNRRYFNSGLPLNEASNTAIGSMHKDLGSTSRG